MGTRSPCIPRRYTRDQQSPPALPHPESSIRPGSGRTFPGNPGQRFKSQPGQTEFPSASAFGLREPRLVTPRSSQLPPPAGVQRPRAPSGRPRAAPAAGDTHRSGALVRRGTARLPARSLTREAEATSPLWLLSGFRTQAPTAAASTIPAADAGTARPPSRVPCAPEGAPLASPRATTCGGGPSGHGPLGRARSV